VTRGISIGQIRQTMAQTHIILEFSKNKRELNTMKREDRHGTIPDPLTEVLVRIIRRMNASQHSSLIPSSPKKSRRSDIVKTINSQGL
jgi:hypothetical protein